MSELDRENAEVGEEVRGLVEERNKSVLKNNSRGEDETFGDRRARRYGRPKRRGTLLPVDLAEDSIGLRQVELRQPGTVVKDLLRGRE